jgi:chromate transport protein ChrA
MLYGLIALAFVIIVTYRYVQSGASIRSKQIMVAIVAGSLLASWLFPQIGSIALWLQIACAICMAIYLQVTAKPW